MIIRCFPYDFQYRLQEGKVLVYVYSLLPDAQKVCVIVPHEPFFYAGVEDIAPFAEKLLAISIPLSQQEAKIVRWERVEKDLVGKKKTFWKIFVNVPKAVPPISREVEQLGIPCYEKDILFIHRFLRDKNILPLSSIQAEGEWQSPQQFPGLRVPAFAAKTIRPAGSVAEPSNGSLGPSCTILALDIETYAKTKRIDMDKNPILMAGFSGIDRQGNTFQKVITWRSFPHHLPYVEVVADEAALLRRCRDFLVEFQPTILTTYNGDGFDLPYLQMRAKQWNVPFEVGLDSSSLITGEESKINGILHLDVHQFIRRIFGRNLKTDSYSLDAVSQELLGNKKHPVNLDQLSLAWDERPELLEEFCKYNLRDADLTLQLCQKLLPDMMVFSHLTGLPLFDVIRLSFSRLVEAYILKKAGEYNILAPNRPSDAETQQRQEERYEGGFVYQPQPGLYSDIMVFDFRSLYPSIITAHNLSPESLQCSCCKDRTVDKTVDRKVDKIVPGLESYWFCQREKKFLPRILEELIVLRAELKKQLKSVLPGEKAMLEARSYALKLLANSFYGYYGYFGARWYSFPTAQATTAYARNYIQETMKRAEQAGFKLIYGDTDSLFVQLRGKLLSQAKQFQDQINQRLPGSMELELEGFYPRAIFVPVKHGEKGAKKKYALLREDGTVKVTGFEMVRRNWSLLAKEVQREVLGLVLREKTAEALQYVRIVMASLKEGKIPLEKLVLKTKLTRNLDQYHTIGPHVMVARKMQQQDLSVGPGTMIYYVIVKGPGIIRDRAALPEDVPEGKYDADYYLHHQLLPAVESILAVAGYSREDVVGEGKQKGLGEWG